MSLSAIKKSIAFVGCRQPVRRAKQFNHARRRLRQRYNLSLSYDDWLDLARRIAAGDASFVEARSGNVTMWRVQYQSVAVLAVVGGTGRVLTFLPEEAGEPWWLLVKRLKYTWSGT